MGLGGPVKKDLDLWRKFLITTPEEIGQGNLTVSILWLPRKKNLPQVNPSGETHSPEGSMAFAEIR